MLFISAAQQVALVFYLETEMMVMRCLFLILLISGCATTGAYEQKLQSWMGGNVNSLISSWGPPAQVFPMSNGNKLYTYGFDGGSATNFVNGMALTQSYWCKTTFTADPNDKIIDWRWEGNSCRSY